MKSNYKQLGQYIRQVDVRNVDGKEENLLGVSVQKQFIPSIANTVGTDFSKYKVVKKRQFTYIPDTSRRGDKIGIALLEDYEEGLVSNVYTVFEVIDENQLMPEYLMLWFKRPEFDRYARFKSHGSVREVMDWDEMCKVELPVPPIEKQRNIVKAYQTITDRIALKRKINENLDVTIQTLFQNILSLEGLSLPETIIKNTSIPTAWNDTTVEHIAELQTGPFGTQLHSDEYVSYGTPVINVKNIGYGKFITQNMDYLDDKTCDRLFMHRLKLGDIVFGRKGSIDRHAFINNNCVGWVQGSDCIRVRAHNPRLGLFLHYWFSQPVIKQLVISSSVGSTMASLNTKILGNIRVIMPPKDFLEHFYNCAKSIMETIEKNEIEMQKIEILQQTMITRLSSY